MFYGQPCCARRRLLRGMSEGSEYDFEEAAAMAKAEEWERKLAAEGYACPLAVDKFMSVCYPAKMDEGVKAGLISKTCKDAILGGTPYLEAYIM